MKKVLNIFLCNFLMPEVAYLIKHKNYPDIRLNGYNANCGKQSVDPDKIAEVLSKEDQQSAGILISAGPCLSFIKDEVKRLPNLRIVQMNPCFELFLNSDIIYHYISEGSYIVTSGWLKHYKKHIQDWGFDAETARLFFKESLKNVLFLDTKIPGDYKPALSAVTEYMGLPYTVLPVGLSHCENFINGLISDWRAENERNSTNLMLSKASMRLANYYVIFNQLDTLIKIVDESEIVQVVFELINVLYAPANIEFISYLNDRKLNTYVFKENPLEERAFQEVSFEIEVNYQEKVIGVFKVLGIRFPQYVEQYKEMGKIISQISALSIANAREYKLTQEQKEQLVTYTKELQAANRSKDKFISIISHDLKSPFNILIGYCNILLEEIENHNIKEIREYGLVIQQTLENTMNLLNNLLEWSRNKSGMIRFKPDRLNLGEFIDKSIMLLDQQARAKSISLSKTIPSGSFVSADKDMLSAIVRNLVSNAIKYTRPGGIVKIAATTDLHETIISVSDNGVGMGQEKIDKLFQLGFSDSTLGTNQEKGTGLGLFLSKDFVEAHHGRIWVESEFEKGSTFYFTIPNLG